MPGRINADKAAATSILNSQLKKETGKTLKEEVIQKAMTRVEFTWDPIGSSLRKSAEAAHRIGMVKRAPELSGIYSLQLLNAVLKAKNLEPVLEMTP